MPPPRVPSASTVDLVTVAVKTLCQERLRSLQVFEEHAAETRQWLATSIQACKQQILASSVVVATAAPVIPPVVPSSSKPATKKAKREILSPATMNSVKALKVKQLQSRLKDRGLNVAGVKKVLRNRLLVAMEKQALTEKQYLPLAAEPSRDSDEVNDKDKDKVTSMPPPQDEMQISSMKKKAPAEAAIVVAHPIDPPALDPCSPQEKDPDDHISVSPPPSSEPKSASTSPAVARVPSAADDNIDDDDDDDDPMQDDESVADNGSVDVASALAVGPSCDTDEPMLDPTATDTGCVEQSNRQRLESMVIGGQDMEMDHTVAGTLNTFAGKRSRSPLKLVQSAMKLFSAKKQQQRQQSPSSSLPAKPVPVLLSDLASKTSATSQSDRAKKNSVERAVSMQEESDEYQSRKVSDSQEGAFEAKSGARLLDAPAVGGSLSSAGSSGVKAAGGVSALKSSIVKAKNDARKAKLAEIRGKSKPVVSKPLATPVEYTSTLSSLKSTSDKSALSSVDKDGKRKLLAAQMREKAAAAKLATKENAPASAAKSSSSKVAAAAQAYVHAIASSGKSSAKTMASPPSVASKQSILSPLDTYELSDREASDSDSDSDEESNSKPKKHIPAWAQKVNLIPALEKQYTVSRNEFDPDEVFGEVQTCDLTAIFDQKKTRYQRRTSSGNWNQDRATAVEKLTYKRVMGYKRTKA